jgi:hypothetical protein
MIHHENPCLLLKPTVWLLESQFSLGNIGSQSPFVLVKSYYIMLLLLKGKNPSLLNHS